MSSEAAPEPDEADASVAGLPPPAAPKDAVTEIMPIIAPWPAPGEEPPPPPNLWFAPADPAEAGVRGVAIVDANASTMDESAETIIGEVVEDGPTHHGPVALESDSWEHPTGAGPPLETARPGRSPKVWVAVGVAIAALIAAIAIPFAFEEDPGPPSAAGRPTAQDEPAQISAESSGPAATPLATAAAAAPSPSSSPTAPTSTSGPGQPAPPTATATTNPPTPPPPPAFTPVTFEAENGTRTGTATIWEGYPNASGGRLVRNIGNWGGTPGTLRINNVNIPTTGAYTITIYYVHPDGEANRSATVTVSGNSALNVSFTGNSNCCQTKVLSNITISGGTHTITFANPNSHAPSIDRVVISRP